MATLSCEDELLSPLELTALPPLSPTMERAFSEAFADMSELEKSENQAAVVTLEPSEEPQDVGSDDEAPKVRVPTATSPSPAAMASASHNQQKHEHEIRRMSPSDKKTTAANAAKAVYKDSAEAKRARRSAIEKKSRQRRQNVLRRMRDEVKQLEHVYAEMAKRRDGAAEQWRSPVVFDPRFNNQGLSPAVEELQRKYSELSLVAHALEEDQAKLQNLLQTHEIFQQTVNDLYDQKQADIWDSGVPPSSSFAAKFRLLSVAECYAIVRASYEHIQRFDKSDHYQTTGANIMGWTDKRKYDEKSQALQYAFTKCFLLEDSEQLLMRTWDMFVNGDKMEHMSFDGSVHTRFEVLQTLNDDLMIVRRDHRLAGIPTTFAAVQIIFRLQTPTGYTLCMRTISAPEITNAKESHEYFYDVFAWTHFNRLFDEYGNPAGCELISCGSIADQNQLKSTYWLFELVCSILRWENACVAPLFLKHI
ncbi:hypothetical protein PHYBOEH_001391 [Phytophthora boehmeriae]|uniref:Uncharacterized protein n=1 Tax=Phytophthora boehmeriae TaxID=109152 RepID=A0A8T1XCH1_9STRA|nr:hypothetical protein PHYBOEH_001391 [Phytophthora boehmeriae]